MGGPAVPVVPAGVVECGQVDLVDHVDHEPRQLIRRRPFRISGGNKNGKNG
jgi:predicted ATPase with chaperone activity